MAEAKQTRRRLGDFEILGELGRGGMGLVYEARQVSLNRKVALKILAGSLGITPSAVVRFRREAEAAAKLHHTNIDASVETPFRAISPPLAIAPGPLF